MASLKSLRRRRNRNSILRNGGLRMSCAEGVEARKMNKYIGSDFDEFLQQEGLLSEVETIALKRVLSLQFQQEMERRQISRTEMARKTKTSDASVSSLLDPDDVTVTLQMLEQAARALGKTLKVELA